MDITFSIPHAFFPDSSQETNADALRALLDCLIRLNLAFLRTHTPPSLYRSGVRYGRTQIWDSIPALYERGYGDCKSLTCALIAEYRMKGIQATPVFRFNPRNDGSGMSDYHILVQLPDGTFEDPSKRLGMGQNENAYFRQ
jgi:hypothetical protein